MKDDSLRDRLDTSRREISRARFEARIALDQAQAHARDSTAELTRWRDHPTRLRWVRRRHGLRALVQSLRHPLRSMSGAVRSIPIVQFRRWRPVTDHVRWITTPLRGHPFASSATDRDGHALRWLGPASVGGVVRYALFAHPDSTVTWTVEVQPGAQLICDVALAPGTPRPSDDVTFSATVSSKEHGWRIHAQRTLRPSTNRADRQWRRMTLDLPPGAVGEVEVCLKTSLAPGSAPDYAWALWGEPRFGWRRSWPQLAKSAVTSLRRGDLALTLRRIRGRGDLDPRSAYFRWTSSHTPDETDLQRLRAEVTGARRQPVISVITPVHNTDPGWLRRCIESVRAQVYPHWQLCLADDGSTTAATLRVLDAYRQVDERIKLVRLATSRHISAASNAALEIADGEFIALLDHDDELPADALAEIARCINTHPDVDFIYTDEDKLDQGGARCDPYFKPDWSPDHFLNFMYTNHLMVLRRSVVERVGRFREGYEGAQDYDLALRVITVSDRVAHVPKVLYHWRKVPGSAASEVAAKPWALAAARRALVDHVDRSQTDAEVVDGAMTGLFRVRRTIRGNPLVSIVLTTDDRQRDVNGKLIALLPTAIRSITQKTLYSNYEIVVIDNGRLSAATQDFLKSVPHRRVSYTIEGDFNFAHKINFSMRHAAGEHLVVLNDDIEVISSDWLTAMLEYSQDPAIGAVGAKLYFADGRLQHAGIVLGVSGLAAHVFHQAPGHDPGYAGSTMGPRNYSAVTAACMMTRRAVWNEVGGFNEQLAIDFNDVDYCLKVRRAGYRIVFTPYAELYHYESTSHGARTWNPAEVEFMRRTWPEVIARDPYYNVNLTRDFPDYRLGD